MLLPVVTVRWGDDGAGSIHCRRRIEGRVPTQGGRSMRGAPFRWAHELLMSFQQIAVGAPADPGRALSPAPDRKAQVKYDGDILHIIKQYPGCNDARVLAFLRARVHWFGRGTLIHKVFRPSLSTVHAAGRRLEMAGKIKTKVDDSQHHQMLRFYPNTPVWAGVMLSCEIKPPCHFERQMNIELEPGSRSCIAMPLSQSSSGLQPPS
jgi:hypothetical protein